MDNPELLRMSTQKELSHDDKFLSFVVLEDDVSLNRDVGFRYDSLPELRDNYERPSTKWSVKPESRDNKGFNGSRFVAFW